MSSPDAPSDDGTASSVPDPDIEAAADASTETDTQAGDAGTEPPAAEPPAAEPPAAEPPAAEAEAEVERETRSVSSWRCPSSRTRRAVDGADVVDVVEVRQATKHPSHRHRSWGQRLLLGLNCVVILACFVGAAGLLIGRHYGNSLARVDINAAPPRHRRRRRTGRHRRRRSHRRHRTGHDRREWPGRDVPRGRSRREELLDHRSRQQRLHRTRLAVRRRVRRSRHHGRAQRHHHAHARRSEEPPRRGAVVPPRPVGDDPGQGQQEPHQLGLRARRSAAADRHDRPELLPRRRSFHPGRLLRVQDHRRRGRRCDGAVRVPGTRREHRPERARDGVLHVQRRSRPGLRSVPPLRVPERERQVDRRSGLATSVASAVSRTSSAGCCRPRWPRG